MPYLLQLMLQGAVPITELNNFGTHLDNSGKTIDFELEKKNFSFAGNLLAEIWKNVVIDTYPVTAEYVPPSENISENLQEDSPVNAEWYVKYTRDSQYFLQVRLELL